MTPQFPHHCNRCKFLCRHTHEEKPYDLYYCRDSWCPGGSVAARYGSEPYEYLSASLSMRLKAIVNESAYGIRDLNGGLIQEKHGLGYPLAVAAALALERYCDVRIVPNDCTEMT